MAGVDGQIVLGLDINATTANIQAGLDSILNNTKVKKIVLETAIEKAETERSIDSLVAKMNKKTAKIGVQVDAKDVRSVLVEQQKIASTQAELTRKMQEYRQAAKDVGLTLSKDTWNTFNHAIKTADFEKAKNIIKSAKQQIDDYNKSVQKMNSDTSVSGSVSSIVQKFESLKNVSQDTKNQISQLKAALTRFEKADNEQAKLRAYEALQQRIAALTSEYSRLSGAESAASKDASIRNQIKDAETLYNTLKTTYSTLDNSKGASNLKSSITELKSALDSIDASATGGKLAAQWEKVEAAVKNAQRSVKEYRAEQSVVGNTTDVLDKIASRSAELRNALNTSNITGTGITELGGKLDELQSRAEALRTRLADLDPSNGEDVKNLLQDVQKLNAEFQKTQKESKVFEDVGALATFTKNIEQAKHQIEEYGNKYSAIQSRPELVAELERLKAAAASISTPTELKQWNAEFAKFDTQVRNAGAHCRSFGDILKNTFSTFAQFFSASRLVYKFVEGIKQMVTNVTALDTAMVELKKVTDATSAQFDSFLGRAKNTAVEIGATVTDLVNATANFSRLGYSLNEAEDLAKIATIYNNVGDEVKDIDTASSSIISTLKAFYPNTADAAADATAIIDKFNEVGNNFAISSGGIGDALQRSAASLAAANNSIDESIALVVAANNVVQNPETVGTMWKTVAMRIRGATAELEAAGLETDNMATSTSKLREDVYALTNVKGLGGFDIMADDNNFKSTYEIILGIGKAWKEMSDVNQAALLELLAGKRQSNALAATLNNLEDLRAAMQTSADSAGSAEKEYSKWMDSIEAKQQQFKSAFQVLSSTVVDSGFVKGIVSSGTGLLQLLDNIINKLGGLGNALTLIGTVIATLNFKGTVSLFSSLFNVLKGFGGKVADKIETLRLGFMYLGDGIKGAIAGFKNGTGVIKGFTGALEGVASSASLTTAGVLAAATVISLIVAGYQAWRRSVEETRRANIEAANAVNESSNSLSSAYQTYMEYADRTNRTTAEEEAFQNALTQVTEALGDKKGALAGLTAGTQEYTEALREQIKEQAKADLIEAKKGRDAAGDQLYDKKTTFSINDWGKGEEYEKAKDIASKYGIKPIYNSQSGDDLLILDMPKNIEQVVDTYYEMLNLQNELADAGLLNNEVYDESARVVNTLSESVKGYMDQLYNEKRQSFISENGLPTTLEDFKKYRDYLNSEMGEMFTFDDGNDSLNNIIDNYLSDSGFDKFLNQICNATQQASSISKQLQKVKSDYAQMVEDMYNDVYQGFSKSDFGDIEHIFGNIDTDNRQVLKWTDDNLNKYKDALMSWAKDGQTWEDVRKEFEGSFSTVFGGSGEYGENGIPIAFSPMLQTENGAELLSRDTVDKYIDTLVDMSTNDHGGTVFGRIFALDKEGLEVDGKFIKGLIADVGATAEKTGEQMHFASASHEMDKMQEEYWNFSKWLDDLSSSDKEIVYDLSLTTDTAQWDFEEWSQQLQNLKDDSEALDILKAKAQAVKDVAAGGLTFDINTEKGGIEGFVASIKESVSATGLTTDVIQQVKDRYSDLAGFDPSQVFEKTSHGIKLNVDALRDLEHEYETVKSTYLNTGLDEQIKRYNELSRKIAEATDAQDRANLINEQTSLGKKIEETATLISQYEGLTSAYQKWIDAQSMGESGDNYDSLRGSLEEIAKLRKDGLTNTNKFRAAAQLFSYDDLSDASIEEIVAAYDRGASVVGKFFTEGKEGCDTFVKEVHNLNSEWASMNDDGKWDINIDESNIDQVAHDLGISVDAVMLILEKLHDYGDYDFDLNFSSILEDLGLLVSKATEANQLLKDMGDTDVDFNVNSQDVEDLETQIKEAQRILDSFKNEDGTFNLKFEGTGEIQAAQTLLAALIQQRQSLNEPVVMKVDTKNVTEASGKVMEAIKTLQEYVNAQNELELEKKVGADTSEAEAKVADLEQKIKDIDPDVKANLKLDDSSAENIQASISAITPEMMVKAGIEPESLAAIEGFENEEHTANGKVTWDNDTSAVDSWAAQKHTADGVVNWGNNTDNVKKHFEATGTIKWSNGAGARGTAFVNGSWGASKSGAALGGELGEELVVRDGKFFTIGSDGAEFFQYKKDDIIFNAEQTKQIFEKGKITSGNRRGRALAEGNAFVKGRFTQDNYLPKNGDYSPAKTAWGTIEASLDVNVDNISFNTKSLEESMEDALKDMKETIDDIVSDYEHQILILEKTNAPDHEIVAMYKKMQLEVQKQADQYRAKGLNDSSEYIQALQKQWWDYHDKILEIITSGYEDARKEMQNSIDLMNVNVERAMRSNDIDTVSGNIYNIVEEYRRMQESLHDQAEYYRALGYSDTSDEVSELSKQWWDYHDEIIDVISSTYEEARKQMENSASLNDIQLTRAISKQDYLAAREYSEKIIAEKKKMQESLHDQAEYYRQQGYADTSDEVSELSAKWAELQDDIVEYSSQAYEAIVENARNALDDIQGVYNTFLTAAKEYTDSGFISVDTLQDILEMGVEYLAMLQDENGQLVLNEKNIQKVIKARTQQIGVETALNYIQQLRTALATQDENTINHLLSATNDLTGSTWDLVYAELSLLNLNSTQYQAALSNIDKIRFLCDSAASGVGKISNELADGLQDTSDALSSILEYTIAMIKQETENKIEALEDEIKDYKKIIDLQKESLKVTKEQDNYNKSVADKLKEISQIQAKITQLDLDDSREAQAEKAKLQEDLADLQTDLADYQADYSYDATVDALDKMADAYEEEKNDEIEMEREKISSYQKLYDLAIERIKKDGSKLKNELIAWNEEYGNDLNETIIEAWNNACEVLGEYNYRLDKAMKATKQLIEDSENISTASSDTKKIVGKTNTDNPTSEPNYTKQTINSIVSQMKSNSTAWSISDESGRSQLMAKNQQLGERLKALGVPAVFDNDTGTWYLNKVGGKLLYNEYPKYHTGGIVGQDSTLKDKEVLSILEKGEAVLSKKQKDGLYEIIDPDKYWGDSMIDKFTASIVGGLHNRTQQQANNIIRDEVSQAMYEAATGSGTTCVIENLEVHAPIQVTEKLDKDTIKKHSKLIGQISSQYIEEGFTKRGIKSKTKLF